MSNLNSIRFSRYSKILLWISFVTICVAPFAGAKRKQRWKKNYKQEAHSFRQESFLRWQKLLLSEQKIMKYLDSFESELLSEVKLLNSELLEEKFLDTYSKYLMELEEKKQTFISNLNFLDVELQEISTHKSTRDPVIRAYEAERKQLVLDYKESALLRLQKLSHFKNAYRNALFSLRSARKLRTKNNLSIQKLRSLVHEIQASSTDSFEELEAKKKKIVSKYESKKGYFPLK